MFYDHSQADQDSPVDVPDLHQPSADPVVPAQPGDVDLTGKSNVAPAPGGRKGKCRAATRSGRRCTSAAVVGEDYCIMHSASPQTRALMAQARRLGGAAPRARLGLSTDLEAVALGTSEDQLALLVAVARALASNSISASTAGAITNIVKAAAQIVQADQGEAIRELEERVSQIVHEVPRGRR